MIGGTTAALPAAIPGVQRCGAAFQCVLTPVWIERLQTARTAVHRALRGPGPVANAANANLTFTIGQLGSATSGGKAQ